jgi:phenylacetate-coenzyme A ligase PaaK-like adenylate-forming protein
LPSLDPFFEVEPFSLPHERRTALLAPTLRELNLHHYARSAEYRRILNALGFDPDSQISPEDEPFLPVRLFKEYSLKSTGDGEVAKTMTSSGTTGQAVSKIFLDGETSRNQSRALSKIMSSILGSKRLPMIIIDSAATVKNRNSFSARGAGIRGFSLFGRDHFYALDEDMNLRLGELKSYLEKHAGEPIFLFGFTFMIWLHFLEALAKAGETLELSQGTLLHGGGWKKLTELHISNGQFRARLKELAGITDVHDYYGMVEQTGSIFVECPVGNLHASVFSDVFVRRPFDFSVADYGERGIIQVISVLPWSYPGHSLLTEDEGVLLGEDNCGCGRKGKYFSVLGRLPKAEIRGCSDTYAAAF